MSGGVVYKKPKAELFHKLGQRIRMHFINCPRHPNPDVIEFFEGQTAFYIDFYDEHPDEVLWQLKTSKYIAYSSLIILINSACKCRTKYFRQILHRIKQNPHLRYKLKLIISTYQLKKCYHPNKGIKPVDVMNKVLELYRPTGGTYLYPPKGNYNGDMKAPLPTKEFTTNDRNFLMDHLIFNSANMYNALFMQIFLPHHKEVVYEIDIALYNVDLMPMSSVNQIFSTGNRFFCDFMVTASTNTDFYFYTINPALAIIINNYYFTNSAGVRQGSEQDVKRLIRKLKIERIPFILLQDCSRSDILQIMQFVQKKDFSPLRSFMLFLMSHGHANNVFYTNDGELDLKRDIVSRVQANDTLADAEILVVANMCRGEFDAEDDDEDDLQFTKTDNEYLSNNTVVMYSVPESYASPRDVKNGSSYIKMFCKHFRNESDNKDILSIKSNIDKDLVNTTDYYWYLQKQPTDLIVKDDGKSHCILTEPVKIQSMIDLIDSTIEDFPILGEGYDDHRQFETTFYVCGTIAHTKVDNVTFVDKYFSKELDRDQCDIDEE